MQLPATKLKETNICQIFVANPAPMIPVDNSMAPKIDVTLYEMSFISGAQKIPKKQIFIKLGITKIELFYKRDISIVTFTINLNVCKFFV